MVRQQSNIDVIVEFLLKISNSALRSGYDELGVGPYLNKLESYFKYCKEAGLYNEELRHVFPNPAYDRGAKILGENLLAIFNDLGWSFESEFPGIFEKSYERTGPNCDTRVFENTIRMGTLRLPVLISFDHKHDHYAFINPPILTIAEASND
jgi:hypothetical protein